MVKPVRLMGQFPPLPPGRAIRQIIADGLIGQWRLLMGVALLPFILALIVDVSAMFYLDVRGVRDVVASPEGIAVSLANLVERREVQSISRRQDARAQQDESLALTEV